MPGESIAAKCAAILHSGLPKIGSISIRSFLDKNATALESLGLHAVRSTVMADRMGANSSRLNGYLRNFKDTLLIHRELGIGSKEHLKVFRQDTHRGPWRKNCEPRMRHASSFPARSCPTCLSNLKVRMITASKLLVTSYATEVKIIAYLRRQDPFALSHHSARDGARGMAKLDRQSGAARAPRHELQELCPRFWPLSNSGLKRLQ